MIYTKTGDGGTTSLVGGSRVNKDDARVEAYGTVDELNAHIGHLAEMMRQLDDGSYGELKKVQHNLFTLQTLLATEDTNLLAQLPPLRAAEVEQLERQIDAISNKVPPLHHFVIAGGNSLGTHCHICRTVCRRAERRVVTLARQAQVDDTVLRYLNRLSDYLFVLARHAVVASGGVEDFYVAGNEKKV